MVRKSSTFVPFDVIRVIRFSSLKSPDTERSFEDEDRENHTDNSHCSTADLVILWCRIRTNKRGARNYIPFGNYKRGFMGSTVDHY